MIEIVADGLVADAGIRAGATGGKWITIADLRQWCPRLTDAQIDAAITRLAIEGTVTLIPEENQKALTADVEHEGITVGGERKHLITFH